ncbi:unnamed protein product [Adineta steineri]|uniref:Polypeptide N-acetylgalactosaminyltransferase n=1 Tax=Adineta steineri TaxID=433720 RepID=A0A815GFW8_9BILA|nr:unnamed protein product [Adineta steineri]CAF1383404.1 unnamed protein product [Adineta steineri]CAF1461236.1 unnamed protein product [Adineta steineri]CAF3771559.1 unnamed protein product [Adineta steineri]CAF3788394.1 unnamed protein product [Adineta steineri]
MRRRPGTGNQSPGQSSRESLSSYRFESSFFSNHTFQTIVITSIAWSIITGISIFIANQYFSSISCPQNKIIQNAVCSVGHALTRFCPDTYRPEDTYDHPSKNEPIKSTHKISSRSLPTIEYTDIYEDKACDRYGKCDQGYRIPAASSIKSANPSNWPGEMGTPFLPPANLEEESKRRFPENMFDIAVSDKIALNRAMPDIRNDQCKAHTAFNNNLPNTSIIIVFHNEGNSTLLRTLVSIINRTPWRLIHEIILLDDASVDREYLHEPLQRFIETLPVKTILLKNEKRLGLIGSRVKAAKVATGETLMFLDSHVEVLHGWLLYLLEEIQKDPKSIVCPIIDVLTWNAFELLHGATDIFGTFSWKMIFRWSKIQGSANKDFSLPIRTPTMAGGLYAIDRLYFEELGMYDEGIKIWGGENLEMSFKCWMCGGRILIHPCSHVAHVFRKETPYKFLEHESIFVTIFKNYKRVAAVWLDEYKHLIYAVNPDIKNLDGGDVSDRLELRERLNCSSFKSYLQMFKLKNFPFNHRYIGSISTTNRRCLDSMMGPDISKGVNTPVLAQACHSDGGNQIFLYTTTNKIYFDEMCLEPSDEKTTNRKIIFTMCQDDKFEQNWEYDEKTLQLKNQFYDRYCLQALSNADVILAPCDTYAPGQKWSFNQEVDLNN